MKDVTHEVKVDRAKRRVKDLEDEILAIRSILTNERPDVPFGLQAVIAALIGMGISIAHQPLSYAVIGFVVGFWVWIAVRANTIQNREAVLARLEDDLWAAQRDLDEVSAGS